MTGKLIPMVVVPGTNVRPTPECADNLLLALIMDMGCTLFITDQQVQEARKEAEE